MFNAAAPRHKIFVSYHHAGDQAHKESFIRTFGDAFDDFSVRTREIPDNLAVDEVTRRIRDEHIRDATVTVVLIGKDTWRRKYVDWEIYSSLRDTRSNFRNGLLGILLPSYGLPQTCPLPRQRTAPTRAEYCPNNIPPRLWDNVPPNLAFGTVRPWPNNAAELRTWIHEAFQRRDQDPPPNLSRERFGQNWNDPRDHWIQ
jgi:hypothetical protein